MALIRFTAIGHVTHDRLEQGVYPGGSALYAGLTAAALGAKVRLHTSLGPDFIAHDLLRRAGIELVTTDAAKTTCFEERYERGKRFARVLAKSEPLTQPAESAEIVFACPVIGEVESSALAVPPVALLGMGLQGWLRRLDANGVVERFLPSDLTFIPSGAVLFCSREDVGDQSEQFVSQLRERARILVLTDGPRGAIIFTRETKHRVHAAPAHEVDPTGAGDVFAACFLIGLANGKSPLDAAVMGACGASLVIGAAGPSAIGQLRCLDERVEWYRRNIPSPDRRD